MTLVYLQVLRFIAAMAVVMFHSLGTGGSYTHSGASWIFAPFAYGDRGVDLFFVISGFVITLATMRSPTSPKDFLLRRTERVVPLYWTLTSSVILLALFVPRVFKGGNPFDPGQIVRSFLFSSFTAGQFPVIYVGWSLEYEMVFYLVVTLWLATKRQTVWDDVIVLFAGLAGLGAAASIAGLTLWPAFSFATSPLVLEFALGVIAARRFEGERLARATASAVCVALVLVALSDRTSRLLTSGLPSLLLVWLAARFSPPRTQWSMLMQIGKRLGDASYSIYLVQILTISALDKLVTSVVPAVSLNLLAPLTAAATLCAGLTCYYCVERPLSHFVGLRRGSRMPRSAI